MRPRPITQHRRRWTAGLSLLLICFGAWPAWALTGVSISAPDTLDSRLPQVVVAYPTGGEIFSAAQSETLRWTIDEQSWAPGSEPVELVVRNGGDVLLQQTVAPEAGGSYAYVWDVPLGVETAQARFSVAAADRFGWAGADSGGFFAIEDHITNVPAELFVDRLGPAWPNPFNPSTTISFSLRSADHVRLGVYDLRGRLVTMLVDGPVAAGSHEVQWHGRDHAGVPSPSGAYFARMAIAAREGSPAAGVAGSQHVNRLTLIK